MREQPMQFLVGMLLETEADGQRIVVLSGLGGSGKTQMALKFARDYEHRYVALVIQHGFTKPLLVDTSTSSSLMLVRPRTLKVQ
jgi:anion-transporting  ArsA/GET3 family ATPase